MAVCSVVRPNLNSDWVEKIFIAIEIWNWNCPVQRNIILNEFGNVSVICAIASICGKIAVNLMDQIGNLNLSIA